MFDHFEERDLRLAKGSLVIRLMGLNPISTTNGGENSIKYEPAAVLEPWFAKLAILLQGAFLEYNKIIIIMDILQTLLSCERFDNSDIFYP